jgi:outer membrane protein TolC
MKIKHYRRRAQLILPLLLCLNCLSAQEELTLELCLDHVRSAHPNTQQLSVVDAIRNEQLKINHLAYLPQLNLNGMASWQSDVTHVESNFPGVDIPSPDQDQYTLTADLVQPIYNGGRTKARSTVVNKEVAVSVMQQHLDIQSVEETATILYYQVILQHQLAQVQTVLIDQLTQVITRLEQNYHAGTVGKDDLLEAQINQREAVQNQGEALKLTSVAKASLAVLMQIDTSAFRVEADPALVTRTPSASFNNRVEVRLIDARIDLLHAQDKLNRSQYHPKLSAFATVGYGKPGLNFLNDAFDTYTLFGASLHIPITQIYSGKASRERQVFILQHESLILTKHSLERELRIRELQYTAEIDKLNNWLIEDEEIITMRREIVRISSARLDGGTITTSDYLDHLTDLTLAEQKKVTHATLLRRNQDLLHQLYRSRNTLNQ